MSRETRSVSVVIPVYNSAGTLRRAVDPVRRQTLRDLELLIVDDGSRDNSHALACELASTDQRIGVIALPENRGKAFAMNRAIEMAAGRWIAVLDADDWYEPERLEILVATSESRDVPMVADNQTIQDAGAERAIRTALPLERGGQAARSSFSFLDGQRSLCRVQLRYAEAGRSGRFHLVEPASPIAKMPGCQKTFSIWSSFSRTGGTGILVAKPWYTTGRSRSAKSRGGGRRPARVRGGYDFRAALAANEDVLRDLRDRQEHHLADLLSRPAPGPSEICII